MSFSDFFKKREKAVATAEPAAPAEPAEHVTTTAKSESVENLNLTTNFNQKSSLKPIEEATKTLLPY